MADTIEKIPVVGEGVTVSLLIWRRFRRPMPKLVERTLDINPGLARLAHIPVGTVVSVPVPEPAPATIVRPVRLWGAP